MKPESIKRRVFIGRVARKAAYVAPAVLALKAAQTTYAGPSGCGQTGSPCLTDPDCCGGFLCLRPNSMPCGGQMDCTCV
ncbi:MAG: hypothetical protein V3S08_09995 [Phycisphaerales bacterium]